MGSRVHYVIRRQGQLDIRYHHWRGNVVSEDIYTGEKRFFAYLEQCEQVSAIYRTDLDGFVLLDMDTHRLHFWHIYFLFKTSAIAYYMERLAEQWPGWTVHHAVHQMADIKAVLQMDGIEEKEPQPLKPHTQEELQQAVAENSPYTSQIIVKSASGIFVTFLGSPVYRSGDLLAMGPDCITHLLSLKEYPLPDEDNSRNGVCIIDTVEQHIVLDYYEQGLAELLQPLWPGYRFTIGDFGTLHAWQLVGIDTTGREMTPQQIKEHFEGMVAPSATYDPSSAIAILEAATGSKIVANNPQVLNRYAPDHTGEEEIK